MTTPLQPTQQRLLQRRGALTPLVRVTLRYGNESQPLIVSGGSVTIDRRRNQRGTADLQVPIQGPIPRLLTPFGGAIDVEAGVRSVNGSESFVPLLTNAVITSVRGLEIENAVIAVQATEASERVARWRFEQPFVTSGGLTLAEVVNLVLTNRGMTTTLAAAGPVLVKQRVFGLEAEKDPWSELIDLCSGFGWRLWLGRDGVPRLDQAALPTTTTQLLVLSPELNLSSRPPNVIVGRWTPTDGSAPVYAIATDDDPSSPTFVGGPYGRVTYYFASPLNISQPGANQAVQTILARERYRGAGRTWHLPFDPTIDPDDVVAASNYSSLPTTVVESLTVDFGAATTRVEVSEVPT